MLYRKILAIHLCTGLFCLAFLAMYGTSAVQLAHRSWFGMRDEVTETHLALTPGLAGARPAARELMDHHSIEGELTTVFATAATINFRIVRPGMLYQVRYSTAGGETLVVTRRSGIGRMLNALHTTGGLWHEYTPWNVWAGVLGLVSLALLTLGATGLYLWLRNPRERWVGIVLLAGGAGMALMLIVSMRM